ncbi:hypothetical protein E3N88_35343 [Mikania micrantha]|uniref:Integrase catalytic domain-containing protein n=1 Tax=Mikania micrantha TaxID=192012 RepID=A0A5N6M3H2_9ASTR|nr:hypothetical protein E3N88_35343 [Mikania micrantha]
MAVPVNQAVVTLRETGSSSSYLCPTLTQTNYTSWAIKMQLFMDAQGTWDAIEPLEGVAVDAKLGKKTRAFIFQALTEDILLQVAEHKEAKGVWDALKTRYLGADRVQQARIQTLNREFELLAMKDSESIDDFAGKIVSIVSKFQTLGANIEDKVKVKKVLNSAPSRFLPIVTTIEQYSDLNTMPFEELIGRSSKTGVKTEKFRSKQFAWALARSRQKQSRSRGRQPSNNDRRDNHADQRNRDEKKPMRCFNCNRIGHFSVDCRAPRRAEEEANMVREDDEPTLSMAKCSQEMVMLSEVKVFPSIYAKEENNEVGQVRFGDESAMEIKGKGSILLQCKNEDQRLVTNVYYIPSLCNNILSLGQFDEGGNKIVINNGVLWMYERSGATLMKVKRGPNRLYKIKLQTVLPTFFLSKMDDTAWLWHARLGHINFETLRRMTKEGMADGLPIIDHKSELCKACLAGKHRRSPFPAHSTHRAEKPLELIHPDLCGPIAPCTSSGNRYFLLLVDDFSRFMWVYIIRSKDQAYKAFCKFKSVAESEFGCKVKALRTNRGGEFTSSRFEQLCSEDGIQRYHTTPYTPQQNGVVERKNQTVLGATRSMMKAMNLPQWLWGETVRHVIYLLNRTPTKALEGKTPYEALKGRKLRLSHLKVFGCKAYVKVPSIKTTKLDDRSTTMVHLGSEPGSKAYRFYNPLTKRICVSRDAHFDETKSWNWNKEEQDAEFYVDADEPADSPLATETSPVQSMQIDLNAAAQQKVRGVHQV